jgi:hypothetical protein
MSERDDRFARQDLPSTTAEFRATPDLSASTAEFKAFAADQDGGSSKPRPRPEGTWPEQPWAGDTARWGGGRRTAVITIAAVIVVAVALIVAFA